MAKRKDQTTAPGTAPRAAPEDPVLFFEEQSQWRDWLHQHHDSAAGVWLRFAKANSGMKSINHSLALDVALCYGWIDGQAKSYDENSWLQKFTPRGKKSVWSKRNQEHVARLIASGEMHAAGLAAIDAAKADGRWERAYDAPSQAEVPDDFAAALARHPDAKAFFDTLKGMKRYSFLHRIQTAVKPETRARRIDQFVALLREGKTL